MGDQLLFWLQISNFTLCLARSIINPFFPPYAKSKGISEDIIGLIIGCNPIGAFFASLVLGKMLKKGIHFELIFFGCVIQGIGMYGFAITKYIDDPYILVAVGIISRLINGVGTSLFFTPLYALVPVLYEKDVESKMSMIELVCGLGFAFGPVLGQISFTIGGYIMPFAFFGTIAIILAFIVRMVIKKFDHQEQLQQRGSQIQDESLQHDSEVYVNQTTNNNSNNYEVGYTQVLLTYSGMMLFLQSIMAQYQYTYFNPFFSEFYENSYSVSEDYVGYLQCIPAIAFAIACPIFGRNKNYRKSLQAFLIGNFILGLGCIFLGPDEGVLHFQPRLYQSLIAQAIITFCTAQAFIYLIPIYNQVLNGMFPIEEQEVANISSALFNSGLQLGEFIGPILGGLAYKNVGFARAQTYSAFVTFAVNIVFIPFVIIDQKKIRNKELLISLAKQQ